MRDRPVVDKGLKQYAQDGGRRTTANICQACRHAKHGEGLREVGSLLVRAGVLVEGGATVGSVLNKEIYRPENGVQAFIAKHGKELFGHNA